VEGGKGSREGENRAPLLLLRIAARACACCEGSELARMRGTPPLALPSPIASLLLRRELGFDAGVDVRALVLAWKLGGKERPGEISKEEFSAGVSIPLFEPSMLGLYPAVECQACGEWGARRLGHLSQRCPASTRGS